MASFNSSTGCVDNTCPPFTSSTQVDSYITALQGIITAGGNIKGLNTMDLSSATATLSAGQVNAQSISTSPKLPAVQVWKLPSDNIVIVYVDASGNSSFSYKKDPNNYVKLMSNGSQILPASSPSPGTTVPSASAQAATPWWVWVLIACMCLLIIGVGIMFAMKK